MNNNYYIKKMKYIPINKISLYQKCILNSIKNKNTFMLKFLVKTKLMIKRVSVKLMQAKYKKMPTSILRIQIPIKSYKNIDKKCKTSYNTFKHKDCGKNNLLKLQLS